MNPICGALRAGVCAGLLALSGGAFAEDKGASLTARGGTLGRGLELKIPLNAKLNARLVANEFRDTDTREHKGNRYLGDLNLRTYGVIGDWHPGGGSFHFSFGALFNRSKFTAKTQGGNFTFNGQTYDGEANLLLDFEPSAPYFGIGWSSQRTSGLSLDFELGLMYQGLPLLSAQGSGSVRDGNTCDFQVDNKGVASVTGDTCSALKADLEAEHKNALEDLEDYDVYPVLSLGLQLRF